MRLFSLSTAEQGASMALFDGGELVCESYWADRKTHSVRLMAMVEEMIIGRAGLALSDVDGFIAARGPGSFTGLRIGISVIRGLSYALAKPCAGISSLDGIAYRFALASQPVCVMMDARRGEVYTAVYRFSGEGSKSEERVCSPEQAVDLAGSFSLYVGSGSKAYREMITERTGGKAVFSPGSLDYVSAPALAEAALGARDLFASKDYLLVPTYLRQSDAEIHACK